VSRREIRIVSLELPFHSQKSDENGNCSGEGIEFPTTNLYELESRVLTDHWSIPYKREESLGKCLIASTYLARLGKFSFYTLKDYLFKGFHRQYGWRLRFLRSSCSCLFSTLQNDRISVEVVHNELFYPML